MNSTLRKLALTTHVTLSVSWLGAIAVFLALAVAGLTSSNEQVVRSAYIAMDLIGWAVIVPACLGSLFSGIIQSLGTHWGLFRHYWVIVKFALTVIATAFLLLHMQPVGFIADMVSNRTLAASEFDGLRLRLLIDAAAALCVIGVAIVLSIYKPWGRTSFGTIDHNNGQTHRIVLPASKELYLWIGIAFLILLFAILHLTGFGFKH